MKNYKYGKLINNRIHFAPNPIVVDNKTTYNGSQELYESQGYKRILEPVFDPYDEETEYLVETYTETVNGLQIVYKRHSKPSGAQMFA